MAGRKPRLTNSELSVRTAQLIDSLIDTLGWAQKAAAIPTIGGGARDHTTGEAKGHGTLAILPPR